MSSCSLLSGEAAAQGPELLVAAAADLARLERPLDEAFGVIPIRFVLGSSGMLARQIQQGAPYDLYLSANEKFVADLVASGHLVGTSVRVYACGRLGLWSRSGAVRELEKLTGPEIRNVAIANPAHAPYGMATRQALENRRLWDALKPKIVFAENVRQALQYGESGNADAVITAWSLVYDRGAALVPAEWHAPIRQAAGIVRATRQPEAAQRFLDFLLGRAAQDLLNRGGFPPSAGCLVR